MTEILLGFSELEEVPQVVFQCPEDRDCEDYFKETVSKNSDDRFIFRLSFSQCSIKPRFPNSRDIAVACLLRSAFEKSNP